MELAIDQGKYGTTVTRVTKRLKDAEGRPIGVANDNPILHTQIYEVKYVNGYKMSPSANTIT